MVESSLPALVNGRGCLINTISKTIALPIQSLDPSLFTRLIPYDYRQLYINVNTPQYFLRLKRQRYAPMQSFRYMKRPHFSGHGGAYFRKVIVTDCREVVKKERSSDVLNSRLSRSISSGSSCCTSIDSCRSPCPVV